MTISCKPAESAAVAEERALDQTPTAGGTRRAPCVSAGIRRSLLLGLSFAIVGCSEVQTPNTESSKGPARNLILISLDTVRADHLGAYGYQRPTSPTLDSIAANGALFHNAVAVSPWTRPSNATLLTGVYPLHHGARSYRTGIAEDVPSIAEIFASAGFGTAAVVSSRFIDQESGFGRGFEQYHYVPEWHVTDGGRRRSRNPAALVNAEVRRWLSQRDERRFFLFLHYYDAHSNFAPKEEYRRIFENSSQRSTIDGTTVQLMEVLAGERVLSDVDLKRLVSLYDAELRQLDDEILSLLRYLDEQSLRSSTAILVTSDHGEEFMEHGGVLHARTYYKEVIDVPLFMSGPGIPIAWQGDLPVSQIDVAPTLLSLAGLPVPSNMVGVDLSQVWSDPPANPMGRYLFAEADHSNERRDQYRMVLGPRYKLIFDRKSNSSELYDLLQDPGERRDISGDEPDRVQQRLAALREFESKPKTSGTAMELSIERIEALRKLGYSE